MWLEGIPLYGFPLTSWGTFGFSSLFAYYELWCTCCSGKYVFLSLGHMPRGGAAGSHGNSAEQWENLPEHYLSSWYRKWRRSSYHPANAEGVHWYLMVFTCILVLTSAGVSNLWATRGHTGRRKFVLGHTLNTLQHVITKNSHNVLSKFTISGWAAFTATLDGMWTLGRRLDTPDPRRASFHGLVGHG